MTALHTALRVGLATLRANPLRTVLSTLGVVIGVASLVAVLAVGDGMEQWGLAQIQDEGLHTLRVQPNAGERVDGVFIARDPVVTLTTADAFELAASLPKGSDVAMMASGVGLVSAGSGRARGAQLQGVLPPQRGLKRPELAHGRLITADDVRAGRRVAVVSTALADSLAAPRPGASLLDASITIGEGTAPITVVGIGKPIEGAPRGNHILLPVGLVPEVAVRAGRVAATPALITVDAPSVEQVQPVKAAIERWAAARWGDKARELTIEPVASETRREQMRKGILAFKLFMGAIVGISLIVGGIGIMNVLLASVTERTREIGIRKTTGARRRDILQQFLAESVVITSAGAAIGVALGLSGAFGITALIRHFSKAPIYAALSVSTFLVAIGVSVATGLVFGTYPARRAARLSPIDAIRHE